jgi:hypothetical protein
MEEAMPKVKQVLKHVSVEPALAKRKCYRKPTKHQITKGEICLVVKDSGSSSNYCPECAEPILDQAQEDLDRLRAELNI